MLSSFLVSFSHLSILILPGFVGRTVLISHFSGGNSKKNSHFGNAQVCTKDSATFWLIFC